ncbi:MULTISPECIES: MFS transporter [unclassified Streptomyces]|uniref:MFS transporter n=1 Tax=unclassified Streptomyces TaxID=2593676 RepID=UPI00068E4BBE|nr:MULTISPECIES: MFS transporter [unclassified Streptomyces]
MSDRRPWPPPWWGLPRLAGHRRFVAAILVDSLGSGMFLPFSVVYFVRSTTLSLTTVGACMSAAALIAMAGVPAFGPVIDRFGPGRAVALSSLLQAVGFFGYLGVEHAWQLVGCAVLAGVGQNLYWTASGPAVLSIAAPGEQDRWFSLVRALRNIGMGAGTVLFAAAEAAGGAAVGRTMVLADAVSFVVAGALAVSSLPAPPVHDGKPEAGEGERVRRQSWRGYGRVLRDAPFTAAVTANLLLALCTMVMPVILAVYLTGELRLAGWFAGAVFTVNTVLVAGTQTVFSRLLDRVPALTTLRLSALLWALCFVGLWAAPVSAPAVAMAVVGAAIVCFTAAEMAHAPVMSALVGRLAPRAARGRYFALHQLSWSIATALAPTVFTWLLRLGAAWLWTALLAACLVSAVLLRPPRGRTAEGGARAGVLPGDPAQVRER